MKNYDDPDLTDAEARRPTRGPRVEILGDPSATMKGFHEKIATSISGDVSRIAERFAAANIYAPAGEALGRSIGASLNLETARGARKDAIMKSLRAVDVPRIDVPAMVTTRAKPLEFTKPVRPVADMRLEELVDSVNLLIDLAKQQNEAVLALDEAMDERHVETERRADARAARADNRAAWGVTFAGLAALIVVIEFFVR